MKTNENVYPWVYWTERGYCYLLGRRYHHGLAGLQLAAAGAVVVGVGIALMWDDRKDIRQWFRLETPR